MSDIARFETPGSGPRAVFGPANDPSGYLEIGAYSNRNNIDTKDRQLWILSSTTGPGELVVVVNGLPDASTAPPDANMEVVMIDRNTGRLYIQ